MKSSFWILPTVPACMFLGALICRIWLASTFAPCPTGKPHHWGKWETPTKGKSARDTYLHRSCTECGMQQVTTAESE